MPVPDRRPILLGSPAVIFMSPTLQAVDHKAPQESQEADVAHGKADTVPSPDLEAQESVLADSEVRRRLRRLGHPVTLFAEEISARYARLRHIERTVEVHDEEAGGGERANVLHTIAKEDRLKAQAAANQSSSQRGADVPTPPKTSANAEDETQVRLLPELCPSILRWDLSHTACTCRRRQKKH